MASAYAWCEDRSPCPELEIALAIRTFGVDAVLGRAQLFNKEIRAFKTVLGVYDTFQSYSAANNLNQWIKSNPKQSEWWFELVQREENANSH